MLRFRKTDSLGSGVSVVVRTVGDLSLLIIIYYVVKSLLGRTIIMLL
jgi:ABC-type arginine transport system permease subunit